MNHKQSKPTFGKVADDVKSNKTLTFNKVIDGVKVKRLTVRCDERGRLMEMLRSDDEIFAGFGQVYMTTAYPGVVKAWHYHELQADTFFVVKGMMKIVLFDGRGESPTFDCYNEYFAGEWNPIAVQIPERVMHGFKCISETEAIVVNIPNMLYNYDKPDEYRTAPHGSLAYDWSRVDG